MRYLAVIALILCSPVFAADTSAVIQAKNVIKAEFSESSGATVKTEAQILRLPSGDKSYKSFDVKYSVARLREMMKGTNPGQIVASAALAAAVAAAGYAIDELTGQITSRPEPDPGYLPGYYWEVYAPGLPTMRGKTVASACAAGSTYGFYFSSGTYCGRGSNKKYASVIQYSCTNPPRNYSVCTDTTVPTTPGSPVSDAMAAQLVVDAFNSLTASQKRMFFEDLAGNPAITPELAAALQAEADRLRAAEGLTDSTVENPNGETETSQKPQEVTIAEPVKIDGSEIDTSAPSSENSINASDYAPLTNIINALPALPDLDIPDFGLNYTSGCRTIDFEWNGTSVPFPSTAQCAKLTEAKEIVGWFISVITMFGIAWLVLGKTQPGV